MMSRNLCTFSGVLCVFFNTKAFTDLGELMTQKYVFFTNHTNSFKTYINYPLADNVKKSTSRSISERLKGGFSFSVGIPSENWADQV